MGAWGYCLFQSDTDCDIIHELDQACGVAQLAADTGKGVHPVHERYAISMVNVGDGVFITSGVRTNEVLGKTLGLSIYAGHCSDQADLHLVRDHLNSGGLEKGLKFCNHGEGKRPESCLRTNIGNAYCYVFLGAAAMTVGATLPQSFIDGVKAKYKHIGLNPQAVKQLSKALRGDNQGYIEGTPYQFQGSLDLEDTMLNPRPDHRPNEFGKLGFNVLEPHNEVQDAIFGRNKKTPDPAVEGCTMCGRKQQVDGTPLLNCAKCKVQKYCSKGCQKAHWKVHKSSRRAPTS